MKKKDTSGPVLSSAMFLFLSHTRTDGLKFTPRFVLRETQSHFPLCHAINLNDQIPTAATLLSGSQRGILL